MFRSAIVSLMLLPVLAGAQIIPENMSTDWTRAGNYIFPEPAEIVNVTDFGAIGDGVQNDFPAVQAAISSLEGQPGIIEFPQGSYLFRSSLNLPSGVILRGNSANSVSLKFDLNGASANCINIIKAQTGSFYGLSGGYTKGSSSLTIESAGAFQTGDYVEIRQENGAWDTQPATWAAYSVGMISRITGINGNTLELEDEFRISLEESLNPQIRKIEPVSDAGVECLRIERVDQADGGYNIHLRYAVNCRIRGVESHISVGSHVLADASAHLEISGSYFHEAFVYDGVSTRGYGVTLIQHTSDCLIENNIFRMLRHAMVVKQGANGNVFAYNYSIEPNRSEFPSNAGGDISLHGHYPFANLFEGNIVQTIHIDQAQGPSGPYNTFFRNRAELYGIIISEGTVNSDYQVFIGNEVTNTGFLMGNYLLSGSGHFTYGNNIRGSIQPSGTGTLADDSYYLDGRPSFWPSGMTWPSIGTPNALGSGTVPAKTSYLSGFQSACEGPVTGNTGVSPPFTVIIFPNPFTASLRINLETSEPAVIRVKDLLGKELFRTSMTGRKETFILDKWPDGKGLFFVEIEAGGVRKLYKVIKAE